MTKGDVVEVTRGQALRFRYRQQGLAGQGSADNCRVLDLGVQDTGGPRAAQWALALRGCDVPDDDLLYAWTIRGAPHAYRRREAAQVAAATAPYDESDAAKRIFDAAKPLRAAGIPVLEALDTIAGHLRELAVEPIVKGDASTALTARLDAPYLRECRPCDATHAYEQPFRLAALRGGLELVPDTSPPVLRRIEGWDGPAAEAPAHLDPIRALIHVAGPTTPKLVAEFLDAPVATVKRHWPDETATASVDGQPREVLVEDVEMLLDPPLADGLRLLGAFDPWLQVRDRDLLVAEEAQRKDLWRTLGRPGAVLVGHEIVGTWRPRSSGSTLRLLVDMWDGSDVPAGVDDEAERLAAHRGKQFGGYASA